ncbi:Hypothetical Protein FCC1311_090802 [Hondaea fermentalgiana]|uniref:Uncharacterized protein n=1 Tax=Hondaea fermentalgiana TaxID=2315210 RepID=A0A2R5GQG5_9STRA|nr:Hypothetical Protein FCC1311_090802 [Hondaea fermentalgiana]|eukprot:GBG32855.1 Hypothetical Protein FCC1311_090802 [Hondaea fermentalgiana]
MTQIMSFDGTVTVKPRKLKQVTEQGSDGATENYGRLPELVWRRILNFLAESTLALIPLYKCNKALHKLVVDVQDVIVPQEPDAITLHLLESELGVHEHHHLVDRNDEFADMTAQVQAVKEINKEHSKRTGRKYYGGHGGISYGSIGSNVAGFEVDPKLVKLGQASLPKGPRAPEWAIEQQASSGMHYTARPTGARVAPIQMHMEEPESGDGSKTCTLMVRYPEIHPNQKSPDDWLKKYCPEWWLHYVALRFLEPRGYVMNGSIVWVGEYGNAGLIEVQNNKVDVFPLGETDDQYFGFPRALLRYASDHHLLPLFPKMALGKKDPDGFIEIPASYSLGLPGKIVLPGITSESELKKISAEDKMHADPEGYLTENLDLFLRYPEHFTMQDRKLTAKTEAGWSLSVPLPAPKKARRQEEDDTSGAKASATSSDA